MPLYEYKCTNCGKVLEFIMKSGDAPVEGCRFCGEKRLERVLYSKFSVGKASAESSCAAKDFCGSACSGSKCNFGGSE
ncbi:MAG: zinc ribbon domain-containing protein [Deltaproteobacteria bacterium]|nr:zinc ribbon domain-containing protein [Deltaproteobacteria bacterium]